MACLSLHFIFTYSTQTPLFNSGPDSSVWLITASDCIVCITGIYFDADVEPQLQQNMEVGCSGWTNNAFESMNHVFKQQTQWSRLQNLRKLIEKCRSLVDAQYKEADVLQLMCNLQGGPEFTAGQLNTL